MSKRPMPQPARTTQPTAITPEGPGETRPSWSVMIPAYNRTKYLERALRSVLEQAPGPDEMQIEVVDNASTEPGVEDLVQRLNAEVGSERVGFFRNERNLGMAGNWNRCVQRARGQWLHILHDDDMMRPGFYVACTSMIGAHSELGLVFSRSIEIDEDGEWLRILPAPSGSTRSGVLVDALYKIVADNAGQFLRCPAVVVRRAAYEQVGGFLEDMPFAADVEMWARIAGAFAVGYIHDPLALYRIHAQSTTDSLMVREDLTRDIYRALQSGVAAMPEELQPQAQRAATRSCVVNALVFRQLLHFQGLHAPALAYSKRAFAFERSARNLRLLAESALRLGKQKVLPRRSK